MLAGPEHRSLPAVTKQKSAKDKEAQDAQKKIRVGLVSDTCVRLDKCSLISVPMDVFSPKKCESLRELILSFNAITALPPEVGNLRALRALRLDHNKLSELPDTLGQCSALQVLDLDCNKLGGVPLQLGTLVELTTLSLVGNPLGQEVVPGVSRSVAQVYFNLQEGQAPPDERQLQGDKKKQGVAAGTRALLALLREHLDPEACGQMAERVTALKRDEAAARLRRAIAGGKPEAITAAADAAAAAGVAGSELQRGRNAGPALQELQEAAVCDDPARVEAAMKAWEELVAPWAKPEQQEAYVQARAQARKLARKHADRPWRSPPRGFDGKAAPGKEADVSEQEELMRKAEERKQLLKSMGARTWDDWVKRKAEADALRKQQALAWAHKQREAAAAAAAAREAERQALKERESKWPSRIVLARHQQIMSTVLAKDVRSPGEPGPPSPRQGGRGSGGSSPSRSVSGRATSPGSPARSTAGSLASPGRPAPLTPPQQAASGHQHGTHAQAGPTPGSPGSPSRGRGALTSPRTPGGSRPGAVYATRRSVSPGSHNKQAGARKPGATAANGRLPHGNSGQRTGQGQQHQRDPDEELPVPPEYRAQAPPPEARPHAPPRRDFSNSPYISANTAPSMLASAGRAQSPSQGQGRIGSAGPAGRPPPEVLAAMEALGELRPGTSYLHSRSGGLAEEGSVGGRGGVGTGAGGGPGHAGPLENFGDLGPIPQEGEEDEYGGDEDFEEVGAGEEGYSSVEDEEGEGDGPAARMPSTLFVEGGHNHGAPAPAGLAVPEEVAAEASVPEPGAVMADQELLLMKSIKIVGEPSRGEEEELLDEQDGLPGSKLMERLDLDDDDGGAAG